MDMDHYLSELPKRLRQLRLELAWTMEDVARVTAVAGRGVVSNWEATDGRRRTPPLLTLVTLAGWYGVSMDYLLGFPRAERDSAAVKQGKALLKERLRDEIKKLPRHEALPDARLRLAIALLQELAPDAFFLGRIAANLGMPEERLKAIMAGAIPADATIELFVRLVDVPRSWFYLRPEEL